MGSFPSRSKKYKTNTVMCSIKVTVPEVDNISSSQISLIRSSWIKIKEGSAEGIPPNRNGETTLTFFYEQFYVRLFMHSVDFRHIFRGIKVKAGVLCSIINFLCSIETSNLRQTRIRLSELGKIHDDYNIIPWMHCALNDSIVETVRLCLGEGSVEVCDAWKVVLRFTSTNMLHQPFKHFFLKRNRTIPEIEL